jgi:hypothetical protein
VSNSNEMPDLRFIDIPKIENDVLFEELAKDMLRVDSNIGNINLHGRPGQKQDGIDVYGRKSDNLNWIGIQCKVRATNRTFSKNELLTEVNQAKNFNPRITNYFLYTTLNRDNTTQGFEREIQDELAENDEFTFEIKYWEDIEEILRKEEYETVYYRFYYKFFRDNLTLGHSIGKLINLELGFDDELDSHYELIVGKIPRFNDDDGKNVDYYRGTYYIVNLHDKKLEFFLKAHNSNKAVCSPSDIELAFENRIDSYRVTQWIRNFENFDELIYSDQYNYEFFITNQERIEYFKEGDDE